VAEYNREKDRVTVEQTFAALVKLAESLDEEQKQAAAEGLSDDEYVLFKLLFKDKISKAARERLKQASRSLLESLTSLLPSMPNWTKNSRTQADVKTCILDSLCLQLPQPPFTADDAEALADRIYDYVWQRSESGEPLAA
jgi:type I restriction enzyme R subunit